VKKKKGDQVMTDGVSQAFREQLFHEVDAGVLRLAQEMVCSVIDNYILEITRFPESMKSLIKQQYNITLTDQDLVMLKRALGTIKSLIETSEVIR